jgi:hypothetical protein
MNNVLSMLIAAGLGLPVLSLAVEALRRSPLSSGATAMGT